MKTLPEMQHSELPRPPCSPLLLDGATATNLFAAGMPQDLLGRNSCNAQWILEHPQSLQALQKDYLKAGSEVLYAPTFAVSRPWLSKIGQEGQLLPLNVQLVELTREAAPGKRQSGGMPFPYRAGTGTWTGPGLS